MNYGILTQIVAGIIGASAVWMVGRKKSWYRWGYIVGIISQFTWLAMYLYYEQYYILPVLLIYGYAWGTGFINHWIKSRGENMNGYECGSCDTSPCVCAELEKREKIKNGQIIIESLWQAMSKLSRWRMKLVKWLWPDIVKVSNDMLDYYWQDCGK